MIEPIEVEDVKTTGHSASQIILYNDNINSFQAVEELLQLICEHTKEQAEQCALVTHYKGRCCVKTGEYRSIKPMYTQLAECGLSVTIE